MHRAAAFPTLVLAALAAAAPVRATSLFTERQLTFGTFTDDSPAWQPTDSLVVFESQRTGNLDLFKVKTTPSTEIQITFNLKADQNADWSPDGQTIVYSAVATAGLDLYTRSIAGGAAVLLRADSTVADKYPSWSPDGTTIAWEAGGDIFLMPATGGSPTQLTTDPAFDGHPSWSPDGSKIVFQSDRSGDMDIWVIPSAGGTATQITFDPSEEAAPDWSPIGDLIAFHSNRSGFGNIWMVRATGGPETQITSNLFGDDFRPDWSPHGDELAFARTGSIWLVTLPVVSLSVGAGVTPSAPAEGDSVTYTVTVANGGPGDATGVEVTDVLPAGVSLVSSSATQGTWTGGSGVWTVGALTVSQAETLTVVATVDSGTAGTMIGNTAQLTASDQFDADSADDAATAEISVAGIDLAVTKTVDDPTPDPGATIEYTIAVENIGLSTATGVAVTDSLPAGVTYVSDVATQGSYVPASGVWTVGSIAAGAADTLRITVDVDPGSAGLSLTNLAWVSLVDQSDPSPGNDSSSVVIDVNSGVTGVPVRSGTDALTLRPCSPNPFRQATRAVFAIPRAERATLAVYDVRGRRVRTLFQGDAGAGEHALSWDGTDEHGGRAPAGVYFFHLRSGSVDRTRKVVLLD